MPSTKKFGIRVKYYNPAKKDYEWSWVHPPGEPHYEFETSESAHRMKEMCYPLSTTDWVRVEEIFDAQ